MIFDFNLGDRVRFRGADGLMHLGVIEARRYTERAIPTSSVSVIYFIKPDDDTATEEVSSGSIWGICLNSS